MGDDVKAAGYLHGHLEHHLDHLAPFCSLMGWPLIVTEEAIYELASYFYPELTLIHWNPVDAPFKVTDQFDVIVTTLPRIAFDEIFWIAEASLGKRLKTLWLPHGNSDKGHLLPSMEALFAEETVLAYGPKMIDFLQAKGVLNSIQNIIPIGNFRFIYFQKHQQFYEDLLNTMHLDRSFILYAPTWKDAEQSSSFELAIDAILGTFSKTPLVIKIHPNQVSDALAIQRQLQSHPCHLWLDHFPPIYPLLSRTSHLLGDFSSIGYDFLHFNRPMLFFNPSNRPEHDNGRFLHQCGESMTVENVSSIPTFIQTPGYQEELSVLRQKIYTYTFGEQQPWDQILTKVKRLDI